MIRVYYNWRKVYLYPALYIIIPMIFLLVAIYLLFSDYDSAGFWERILVILLPIFLCVQGFVWGYPIIKNNRYIIKISMEDLILSNPILSKVDIIINHSQIKFFKLHTNGLGEIHTSAHECKNIIISIDMINYQKLIDWLIQKGVEQKINESLI